MARRRPASTSLVDAIFGFKEKAMGKKRGKPEKPVYLGADFTPIEKASYNAAVGFVTGPAGAYGGAFAGKLKGKMQEAFSPYLGNKYSYKDPNTGIQYNDLVYDPSAEVLINPATNAPIPIRVQGGGTKNLTPADLDAGYAITGEGRYRADKKWIDNARKRLEDEAKTRNNAFWMSTMGGINKTIDAAKDPKSFALGLVKEEILGRLAIPGYKKALKADLTRRLAATPGGIMNANDLLAEADRYSQQVVGTGLRMMMNGKVGWASLSAQLYYGSNDFWDKGNAAAGQAAGFTGKNATNALRFKVKDPSDPTKTVYLSIEELKNSNDPAYQQIGQALESFLQNHPGSKFTSWGVLNFMNAGGIGDLFSNDPNKNPLNLWYQFAITNQGWEKLSENQLLIHLARTKGGVWQKMYEGVINKKDNHWFGKMTKFAKGWGKKAGKWVTDKLIAWSAKQGGKWAIRGLAQALGSAAPVIGNIIAFIVTELVFIVLDPVLKLIGELIKFAVFALLIIVVVAIYLFVMLLTVGTPGAPGVGGFATEDRSIESEDDIPIVFPSGPRSNSGGSCPWDGGFPGCTQGPHDGGSLDIGMGCGRPVFSMCAGEVIFAGYAAGCADKDFAGYVKVRCSSGTVITYIHINPDAPASVAAGDQIGTIACMSGTCGTFHSTGPHLHLACPGGAVSCLNEFDCPISGSSCGVETE